MSKLSEVIVDDSNVLKPSILTEIKKVFNGIESPPVLDDLVDPPVRDTRTEKYEHRNMESDEKETETETETLNKYSFGILSMVLLLCLISAVSVSSVKVVKPLLSNEFLFYLIQPIMLFLVVLLSLRIKC
jgi:hypothetical protein